MTQCSFRVCGITLCEHGREKWDGSQTSQAQPSEKKKWRYACSLFGTNNLEEGALWRIHPFLGNYCETGNKITTIASQQILNKQQLNYNNRGTAVNGVFYSVRAKGLYNENTSLGGQLSVWRQKVKRILGGWCEMATSLVVSQLKHWGNCEGVCDEKT
jgi:hypothetical protein